MCTANSRLSSQGTPQNDYHFRSSLLLVLLLSWLYPIIIVILLFP